MFLLEVLLRCGIKITSVTSISLTFIILLKVTDNYLCNLSELFTFDELLRFKPVLFMYIRTFLFTFSEFRLIQFIMLSYNCLQLLQ
jgi:hypothetical protein